MQDLEEEEEEKAEEANSIASNVCSLAYDFYHSFSIVNYEMALRDFGSMGKKQ